jgi:xanthine dehydrogenase molybdopterin-binding subunit B
MGAGAAEAFEKTEPAGNGGYVGRALRRKEDPRLITGQAKYTDDLVLPGMLHAALGRSRAARSDTSGRRSPSSSGMTSTGSWTPPRT